MDTLPDVVFSLNYTAREGGDVLSAAANEAAQCHVHHGWSLFDVRNEFPDAWHVFQSGTRRDPECDRLLTLSLTRRLFPFLPCDRALSQHFAAEYYGAPKKSDPNYHAAFDAFFRALLPDTVIPANLTPEEEREACRALKGSMLRQEVYAQDDTVEAEHPYTVTEQNFTIQKLQPRGNNRHGVFFTHARESISYHYERKPADPRIGHALTLEVDEYGNVLKSAAIGYGRWQADLSQSPADRAKQAQIFITYTENRVTKAVDAADDHLTPLPCEVSAPTS